MGRSIIHLEFYQITYEKIATCPLSTHWLRCLENSIGFHPMRATHRNSWTNKDMKSKFKVLIRNIQNNREKNNGSQHIVNNKDFDLMIVFHGLTFIHLFIHYY